MKKLAAFIFVLFIFIACISNPPQVKTPVNTITKVEMKLSAFGVESDDYPSINVYINFEKDSSHCYKSYYNPAFKDATYTLTNAEIKNVLALLNTIDLQKCKKDYAREESDQPTSTTTIYTTQGKFTITDYGLIADAPLPQLYKIVYKF